MAGLTKDPLHGQSRFQLLQRETKTWEKCGPLWPILRPSKRPRTLRRAAKRARGAEGGPPGPSGRPARQGKGPRLMEYLSSRRSATQATSSSGAFPDDQSLVQVSEQDPKEEQEPPCPSAGTLPISQGESSFLTTQDFQAVSEDRERTQLGPPLLQSQLTARVPPPAMSGNACFPPQQWLGGFYFPAPPSWPTLGLAGFMPAAQQWLGCPLYSR